MTVFYSATSIRRLVGAGLFGLALGAAPAAFAAAAPWTLHEAVGAPKALTLSGSVRIRYEAIDNQIRPGFTPSEDFLAIRSTLLAEYRSGALRFGGELWDSRVYGADRGGVLSTGDVNAVEPVQAYVGFDLKEPFGKGTSASALFGRMTLNLGSRRLVAADDYRNTTNGYTGVRLDGKAPHGWSGTLIYVEPQVRLPEDVASLRANRVRTDQETPDLVLWGGLVTKADLPGKLTGELEYLALDERDAAGRPTRNRNLHTFGAHLFRNPAPGRFDYDLEGFRQVGTIRSSLAAAAPLLEVSAGFLHAEAGYQFAAPWKPHLSFEYDIATGDRGAGKFNRFDTLFGMRRADLAPAGLYNAIARANIETPGLRLEVTPSPRWDAFAKVNLLWLDSATDAFSTTGVRDPTGRAGRYAGEQVEGRLRYWIVPAALRFEFNGVVLTRGRFLDEAPNAPRDGSTVYGSAAITATF